MVVEIKKSWYLGMKGIIRKLLILLGFLVVNSEVEE